MCKYIFSCLLFGILISCDNPNRAILGKWMMAEVIQDGKDVTKEHNPEKNRYFIMKEDNTFESDGQPYGKNTGKYTFNPIEKTLFIDSDLGEEDDSNWTIRFEGTKMFWKGTGTEWAERFQIIYVRPKR